MLAGCGDLYGPDPGTSGTLDFDPDRPSLDPTPQVAAYTGADPVVLEAQATFGTGADLHLKVITRTCSPTDGVCHNQKE
ncbi:MAG: hypothetical protein ACI9MR_003656 [Myxococcota bacterium]|jgi:hypothetical protein